MKDKTSIKFFDKFRFKKIKFWHQTSCLRCNRHIAVDSSCVCDKKLAKELRLPQGYTITLCRECRKELNIRRFFDLKQRKGKRIPYKPTFDGNEISKK